MESNTVPLQSSEKNGFNFYALERKGDKEYFVEGYIATYDKDLDNDIISKSAMQDIYDQADHIKMDLEHEAFRPSDDGYGKYGSRDALIPVAKVVEKRVDDIGVWVKAKLNNHISRFGEVWNSIQDGFLNAFSITFGVPRDGEYEMKGDTRILTRLRSLLNVAITGNPVNRNATFTNVISKAFSEEKTMSEEQNVEETPVEESPEVSAPATEETPMEPSTELKAILERLDHIESKIQTPAEPKPEVKAVNVDYKALTEKLDRIEEKLSKPVHKALAVEAKAIEVEESVLDYIK